MLHKDPELEGAEYEIWTKGNNPKLLAEGTLNQIGRTVRVYTKEPTEVEMIVGDNEWLTAEDLEHEDDQHTAMGSDMSGETA